jgi:ribonuclease J
VLTCDSTNVFSPHPGRSEAMLANPILDFVMAQKQMVVATTFASNVARLRTLAEAGRRRGAQDLPAGPGHAQDDHGGDRNRHP